jgi:lipooligosaccharide transport system permease protein
MALFSGTFFPLTLLPVLFQYIALILLPLTHLVAIMRMLTLPDLSGMAVLNLGYMILVTAIFCIVGINLMRKRLIV